MSSVRKPMVVYVTLFTIVVAAAGPSDASPPKRQAKPIGAPRPISRQRELELRANVSPGVQVMHEKEGRQVSIDGPETLIVDLLDRYFQPDPRHSTGSQTGVWLAPLKYRHMAVLHSTDTVKATISALPGHLFGKHFSGAGQPSGIDWNAENTTGTKAEISGLGRHARLMESRFQTTDTRGLGELSSADPERFTRLLSPARPRVWSMEGQTEAMLRDYVVGNESEVATYYDTPDDSLRIQGIAVRDKRFGPGLRGGKRRPSDSRAIFVKKRVQDSEDGFTERDELSVNVPIEDSEAFHESAKNLLAAVGSTVDPSLLRPRYDVENNRFKVDIWYRQQYGQVPEKIGFVTVDQYQRFRIGLTGQRYNESPTDRLQLEVELLPEHQTPEKRKATSEFLSHMKRTYQFQVTQEPKAWQGPR